MRLNNTCNNCRDSKDANYDSLCNTCADLTRTVLKQPENAGLSMYVLSQKVQEALVTRQPALGIPSKPDSRTIFDRVDPRDVRAGAYGQ